MTPAKLTSSQPLRTALLLALLAALYLLPRLPYLGQYVTADEPMFAKQGGQFYYALANRQWAASEVGNHPGVTYQWSGAAGFLLEFPEFRDLGSADISDGHFRNLLLRQAQSPLALLAAERLTTILFHTLFFLAIFLYLRQILGPAPAAFASLLLAFEPTIFTYSRLVHSELFLAEGLLLSLLAFFVWQRGGGWPHLLLSGVFAGVGLLSKTPAAILIPFIGLMALLPLRHPEPGQPLAARLGRVSLHLALWGLAAIVTLFLFYPALWVNPLDVLGRLWRFTTESSVGDHLSTVFFNGRIYPDGAIGPQVWYYYPLTYLWRTTPVVLIGLALAALFAARRALPAAWRGLALLLTAYPAYYVFALNFSVKKFDRYLVPAHLPLALLAALGWLALFLWLAGRWPRLKTRAAALGAALVLLALQVLPLIQTAPYYINYYNPLMGGPQKAPEVLMIGWGEGLDEAARYLNQIPGIEDKSVVVWYANTFNYHFHGVATEIRIHALTPEDLEIALAADYIVTYTHTWQRRSGPTLLDVLETLQPIHRVVIRGVEYAQIYQLNP